MSVKGTEEQQQGGAAPGIMDAPQMTAPGPQAPNNSSFSGGAFGVLNMLSAGANLGGPVEDYLKVLKSYFSNDNTASLVKIEVSRLNEPYGAHAYIAGNCAVVLLFTDTMSNMENQHFVPTSAYIGQAARELKAKHGNDIRLLNAVIVLPGDYTRAQQMAQYISLTLAVATNARLYDMNVSAIAESQFSIDPDVNLARNYINIYNPSSVAPRTDVGFVLYAKAPRRQGQQPYLQAEDSRPIAAVGAYTEIQRLVGQGGVVRYQPIVHITSITSGMPVPGIIPLCLAIAADRFTGQGGNWIQQFMPPRRNEPNLGQLFPDPADPKKQWFCADMEQFNGLRGQYFNDAILAIDVVEGQARIPALAAYANPPGFKAVYDYAQNFFGAKLQLDLTALPYFVYATDYIGVYGDQGSLVDSRNMDYMRLLVNGAQDALTQNVLLHYPVDPSGRSRVLFEKTGGSYKSLWLNTVSVPTPAFLGALAKAVQGSLGIEPPQGQNRMVATDWMQHHAEQYRTQSFSVARYNNSMGYGGGGGLYSV